MSVIFLSAKISLFLQAKNKISSPCHEYIFGNPLGNPSLKTTVMIHIQAKKKIEKNRNRVGEKAPNENVTVKLF